MLRMWPRLREKQLRGSLPRRLLYVKCHSIAIMCDTDCLLQARQAADAAADQATAARKASDEVEFITLVHNVPLVELSVSLLGCRACRRSETCG